METLLAFVIGLMFACGVYCLLRRSLVRLAIGIILISQAANLLVLTSAGIRLGKAPIIDSSESVLAQNTADPLPQALVLTAIVIGFGLIAFVLALIHQTHSSLGHDDINSLNKTDESP
ncbi:MAG: NADH-quinone oxidoreductase subunit K [Verrucomicrobiota bacterium]